MLGKALKNYCVNIQRKKFKHNKPRNLRAKLHELEQRYAQHKVRLNYWLILNQRCWFIFRNRDELEAYHAEQEELIESLNEELSEQVENRSTLRQKRESLTALYEEKCS